MKPLDVVVKAQKETLAVLKSRFPMFHLSNFFFRDVQYGIQEMFRQKGVRITYPEAERIARAFVDSLEREKIFVPIDHQSWAVNYPEYKTPVVKKADVPPKPAAAAAQKQPAAAASGA